MRRLPFFILTVIVAALGMARPSAGQDILVPMDGAQTDHLKAYGVTFWAIENGIEADWLLNYRGGSFLLPSDASVTNELRIRGVSFDLLSGSQTATILAEIERQDSNMSTVRLEKAPRIAVYAPDQTLPWDDAVLLALTYAEVPYDMIYDDQILDGELANYDWLHLHHEDFTGQYGKFFSYRTTAWYMEQQRQAEATARARGFRKVSELKSAVVESIRRYVGEGGFLFAMCSGTDTFDIAQAAFGVDIVPAEYDGDPIDPDALSRLDYERTFAFQDFRPSFNAREYEHANLADSVGSTSKRNIVIKIRIESAVL